MAHADRDIVLHAGDDIEIAVDVFDAEDAPLGLEGATVVWAVAARDASATRVMTRSTTGGGITLGEPANRFVIAIAAGDTATLAGRYRHHAQIIDGAGNRSTVLAGTLTILPGIIGPAET